MKKILLDDNLPRPLAKHFSGVQVISVHDIGWAEKKNGELIRSMLEEGFEYLLTADKNLCNKQNLEKYPKNSCSSAPSTTATKRWLRSWSGLSK